MSWSGLRNSRIVLLLVLAVMMLPVSSEGKYRACSHYIIAEASSVSIHIDYGNGTTAIHEDATGSNVLEATESVALVQVDWTGNLAFVYSINGVSSKEETGKWWQYWFNGEFASVAANIQEIQGNDTIIWRFIESQVNPTSTDGSGQLQSLGFASVGLGSIGVGFLLALYIMRKRN